MIELFSQPTSLLLCSAPYVQFEGENATDLDGLTRELFSLFWEFSKNKYFEEMVPRIDPQTCQMDIFTILGRIISYGYLITGFFPIFVARASMLSVLCETNISDDILLSSFLNYIDVFERESASRMMLNEDFDIITAMLSRFKCFSIPCSDNIEQCMIECAKSELICRPTHALRKIYQGMKEVHPTLWELVNPKCIEKIYQNLLPICHSIWALHLLPTPNKIVLWTTSVDLFSASQKMKWHYSSGL